MPGSNATRPGDIVMAMNGKSIDVQNTDAEGRLVLADCLHYLNINYNPGLMVDVATLTGACLHALGHTGAAVMANDQAAADLVIESSRAIGEPFWQLPLWPELDKEIKGEVSDLANIAKPNVLAGTIVGGVFLREFVGETKWAHLDIAGTGWACKATGYPSAGGSGFALRTLTEICRRFSDWSGSR
jgi:leucyl aminopeptidase